MKEAFENAMEGSAVEFLGKVSDGEIHIDGEQWGAIANWASEYDQAIENLL